jgi:protein O-GlcNAc transferase
MTTQFPPGGARPSTGPALKDAVAAHQAGNLGRAEFLYRLILAGDKRNSAALHFLGLISLQRGDCEAAEQSIRKALKLNPKYSDAHCNLGMVLQKLGRRDEALASYNKAVAIEPRYADAHYNRGTLLKELGRLDDALASYEKALASKPDHVDAHLNRGSVLHELKRFDEAVTSFDKALALRPDYPEAYFNRANAQRELRRYGDALAGFDRALALKPDYAEAWSNRGNLFQELRRYAEALASYDRALAVKPGYAEPHANRGKTLHKLSKFSDAVASYDKALAIKPDLRSVRASRLYAKMLMCDWANVAAERSDLCAAVEKDEDSAAPFELIAFSQSPAEQLKCARDCVAESYPAFDKKLWNGERYNHDKIRIAYMSRDFYGHPVGYAVAGMFEQHDRTRFEPVAISLMYRDDAVARRIKNAFEVYVEGAERSDREIAELVRDLEIDILVDLLGFTAGNRTDVFAHRPAPIQVNYLAYPGTMGASYFDYIVADPTVIPAEHQQFYEERVVWLPDSYHINDNRRPRPEATPTRSECGLPEGAFVFCSFNTPYKITPEMFDIWMRLLQKIENSVMWIYGTASVIGNLRREAEKRGVAPERLIDAPRKPFAEHLARLRQADLFLDTLPYGAHTTANDALWAGLPVLTCVGQNFPGRVGASVLNAIGLPELITHSLEEYEAMALRLAQDRELLASLKARLLRNRDTYPLFDTERSTRHIESAYRTMWERHQRGEPPAAFTVEPIG